MAEWFKAPVLKTGVGQLTVGSNPSLSADLVHRFEGGPFFMLVHIAIDPLTSESTVLSIKKDRKISYIDFNTKSFEFRTLTASYAAITGGEKRTEYGGKLLLWVYERIA